MGPGTATGHPAAPPVASWHYGLDDWLAIPTYWMPASPETAWYAGAGFSADRRRQVAHSITVATVATGSLLSPSLASPSSIQTSGPSSKASSRAASSHGETNRYTVRGGDTIFGISVWLGMPTKALIAANDLPDPNFILPGQQLNIPSSDQADASGQGDDNADTDGLVIQVEAGDTIWGLSRRYGWISIRSSAARRTTSPKRITSWPVSRW